MLHHTVFVDRQQRATQTCACSAFLLRQTRANLLFFDKRRAFIKPETQGGQKERVPEERGEIAATSHVSSVGFREYACLQTERFLYKAFNK